MLAVVAVLSGLIVQSPPQVQVEPIPFDLAAWKALPRAEVRIGDGDRATAYSGIPLAHALKGAMQGQPEMKALRALADAVLVVGAEDDYQAALSAVAVAMDPKGERFLVAFERDGKPLGDGPGPAQLIVKDDPQHVRWVRRVRSVSLVRLPRLPATPRP